MCCAQTAAPEGGKNDVGEIGSGVSAAIKAKRPQATTFADRTAKCAHIPIQTLPKSSQNHPQTLPKLSQNRSQTLLGAHEASKSAQEGPKTRPRRAQRRSRAPQSGPRVPESCPRSARDAPKPLPNRSWRAPGPHFRMLLAESSVQEAVGPIFARFLRCALDGRHAFRIGFSNTKRLLGFFHIASSHARRNIEK